MSKQNIYTMYEDLSSFINSNSIQNGSSGSNENSPRNFRPPNRVPSSKLSQGQVQKEDITERKCPVCSYYFPNLSVQEFQEHVETHFEDDPTDFFELTHVE